ncbi:MAG TPA: metalloregulator ArsR/SmtB family transcription factor [Methylophaga sp.]|nr:metalloregulator ArsR/SmtB family transcription factor [Methylophaga sp.]
MELLQLHKALADDTRLRCVQLIADQGELCVCDLMQALDTSQPKISRHLALLREANLLIDRRQGQWVFYQLHPDLPDWAKAIIQAGLQSPKTALNADRKSVQSAIICC